VIVRATTDPGKQPVRGWLRSVSSCEELLEVEVKKSKRSLAGSRQYRPALVIALVHYGMQKPCDLFLAPRWIVERGDRCRAIKQTAPYLGRQVLPLCDDAAPQSSENLLLFRAGFELPTPVVRPIRCEGATLIFPGRKIGVDATHCRHADTNMAPTTAAAAIAKSASQPNGVNTDRRCQRSTIEKPRASHKSKLEDSRSSVVVVTTHGSVKRGTEVSAPL